LGHIHRLLALCVTLVYQTLRLRKSGVAGLSRLLRRLVTREHAFDGRRRSVLARQRRRFGILSSLEAHIAQTDFFAANEVLRRHPCVEICGRLRALAR